MIKVRLRHWAYAFGLAHPPKLVIDAPSYTHLSSGVRCLHLLCDRTQRHDPHRGQAFAQRSRRNAAAPVRNWPTVRRETNASITPGRASSPAICLRQNGPACPDRAPCGRRVKLSCHGNQSSRIALSSKFHTPIATWRYHGEARQLATIPAHGASFGSKSCHRTLLLQQLARRIDRNRRQSAIQKSY
jgi:hypothetical protein